MNSDTPISITDPHFHLWDLSFHKHAWLLSNNADDHQGDLTPIKKNYLLENYLSESKKYNIEKSVHVQAGWNTEDSTEETAWLQEISIKQGHPHAIVGHVDFSCKNFLSTLEKHLQHSNFKGVRQIVSYDKNPYYNGCAQDFLNNPTWRNNITSLEKYGLSFDLQIYPEQVDTALQLISKNSSLLFIVDHFLKPKLRSKEYFVYWTQQIKKLAAFENVYLKFSGFGMHEPNWTENSIAAYVDTALNFFSIDRCMFASNFPIDKLYKSFDDLYDCYFSLVKLFSKTEKDKLFSFNAKNAYRL